MKRKRIAFMLFVVLFVGSVSSVFADGMNNFYQLRWENVVRVKTYVEESGDELEAYAIIVGNDSDAEIKGRLYLQKYRGGYWVNVKSWYFKDSGDIELSKSYGAVSGTYRTKLKATVDGEQITEYSSTYDYTRN